MPNISPWIYQLNKDRKVLTLDNDVETDIAIVGGGIAGISTAFFILRDTPEKVCLLEGGLLGHGATGHNAGQLTSYFARSLASLVKEFGMEKTIQAQKNIEEDAWELLDQMYTEASLDIPLSRFSGHLGLSSKDHLYSLLEDNALRKASGLQLKDILVADHIDFLQDARDNYHGLFESVPHERILELLETKKPEFIACLSEQKGCMNSALFTEKIAEFLLYKYPDRFSIYEHSHVNKVVLHDKSTILDVGKYTVKAERAVLCTNGFDNFNIFNKSGLDVDTRFHHLLESVIGYMSGYLEDFNKPPIAISYFTDPDASSDDPYIYLTRRMYEYNEYKHNLISIGGPETDLEDRRQYEREQEYPDWARDEIDKFVKDTYEPDPGKKIDYVFTWHGLMGYTANKLRIVGAEPKNPRLLYNLGCNGVGLLPSIFGGEKIARIIKGEEMPASIFDPKDSLNNP